MHIKIHNARVLSPSNTTGKRAENTVPTRTAFTDATPLRIICHGCISKICISKVIEKRTMCFKFSNNIYVQRHLMPYCWLCCYILTNSVIVEMDPPRIHPAPILQSGRNSPSRIMNPASGLFTNAGCGEWKCNYYWVSILI